MSNLFLPVKSNVSEQVNGLTFRIEQVELPGGIITSRVVWTGETDKQASDVLAASRPAVKDKPAFDGAKEWLIQLLSSGPVKAKEVKTASNECPFSWATIRRAAAELGIKSVKRGPFHRSKWYWMTAEQAAIPEYPSERAREERPEPVHEYAHGNEQLKK